MNRKRLPPQPARTTCHLTLEVTITHPLNEDVTESIIPILSGVLEARACTPSLWKALSVVDEVKVIRSEVVKSVDA